MPQSHDILGAGRLGTQSIWHQVALTIAYGSGAEMLLMGSLTSRFILSAGMDTKINLWVVSDGLDINNQVTRDGTSSRELSSASSLPLHPRRPRQALVPCASACCRHLFESNRCRIEHLKPTSI